jgi:hypothetical protein
VIEIAVIRVQRDGDAWLASEWRSLVDPGVPIPAVISRLTGITAAQCAGAPPFAALAAEGGPPECIMIDSTHLKAHRTAASLLKKGLFPDISDAPRAG